MADITTFIVLAKQEERRKEKMVYNPDRADVAQSVEQLIRNSRLALLKHSISGSKNKKKFLIH